MSSKHIRIIYLSLIIHTNLDIDADVLLRQKGDCDEFYFVYICQGRPQDLGGGGGQEIFFFRFGNLHVAKRHAAHGEAMRIARGVRGHAPPRKFFKTVQFGAFQGVF